MFGNQKLEITFGPWQDIIILIAVFLVIFVYGSAFVNMLIAEVKSWFGKSDPRSTQNDEPPVRYEVMWSSRLEGFDEIQLRISSSVEVATAALVAENGSGFVRYRPLIPELEYDWGMAMWREEAPTPVIPAYDNAALKIYAAKDAEATNDLFKAQPSTLTLKDFAKDEAPLTFWYVQWSNNEAFSMDMGGDIRAYTTDYLSAKIHAIIEEHGPGYIRYRASDVEDADDWINNGLVTKDILNAKHF